MLRPTPGDPLGVEQHHWNTGAKENQQLNPGGKISLKSDFIHFFFHDFTHVYSPGAGTDIPQGTHFDVNRKALLLYPFVAGFKEISLKSDFIHFFS